MKICEFSDFFDKDTCIQKIRMCEWSAAQFLADLLENDRFNELLGKGELFILYDDKELISFCTLTERDCIDDKSLFPWIGFVFTAPKYRGHRYSGLLIEAVCEKAQSQGYERVYLATDHIGFYEKYGFEYIESRTDIYNEESRIYCKKL